ncbi:MAG: T9SS type A sorting domain-containing protein, partial [Chitinophagales bacterium]
VEVAGNFGSLNTEVYNTLGERVINTVNFTGNTQLDITNLSAGTYLVKVYDEAGNYTSRQINVVK